MGVVVGGAGLSSAAVVAGLGDIAPRDATRLVVDSTVAAGMAGAAAWLVLVWARRARIAFQAAIASLAPVLAVALGVGWATSRMLLMRRDQWVLWIVVLSAGTVGVLVALLFGGRVADAARTVGEMARRLGEEGPGSVVHDGVRARPEELRSLSEELEQTSVRLHEAQRQAAALESSRRELVAWVSHDLRTPLAGIRAMVEALEDGVVDDAGTVARYYRAIRVEADRLAGLVDDLFELSRIQAGSLSLVLERVALDELVSDAIAGASVAARAKGVELLGEVAQPAPVVQLATPEMARVVRNLLDNAIRHTPAGGAVVLNATLETDGRSAQVSVLDGCGGIPERDIDHVFEMAYRGDAARTPGDGGAGLGLAVARGLVEAHHGQISVNNEGGGCRFTVRLPLSSEPPA